MEYIIWLSVYTVDIKYNGENISGVKVSMLASGTLDREFESRSGKI